METGIIVYLVIGLLIASYNLGHGIYHKHKEVMHMVTEFFIILFCWIFAIIPLVFYWGLGLVEDIFEGDA